MDVTFLESDTFFPSPVSNSPLQGEIHGEDQNWLDVEVLDVNDNLAHRMDGNDMVGPPRTEAKPIPESSDMVVGLPRTEPVPESLVNVKSEVKSEDESLCFLVPGVLPPKNIPEVSSPTTPLQTNAIDTSAGYVLPSRHNCGKPPNRYSLDIKNGDPSI